MPPVQESPGQRAQRRKDQQPAQYAELTPLPACFSKDPQFLRIIASLTARVTYPRLSISLAPATGIRGTANLRYASPLARTRETTWTVVSYHVGRFDLTPPRLDPRHVCFRLRAAPSPIHRYGIFAEESIPRGRKVIEYTGERISRAETRKRYARPMHYLFTLDAYWTIDGAVGGSGAEFINHSCDPNLRAWIHKGHILYMSRRVIRPGEELTVDYKFKRGSLLDICSCGSPKCRGAINVL